MAGIPAGRLEIEILADVARLQKDLDKVRREVGKASRDIGRSAQTANDNLGRLNQGFQRVAVTSGRTRMGMQQLGYQMNDVASGFATGQKASQIFAQQMGQTIQAVQLMLGGTSRLATFLTGPWGIAIGVGAIALIPLINKLWDTKDAAEDTKEVLEGMIEEWKKAVAEANKLTNGLDGQKEKLKEINEIGARIKARIDAGQVRPDGTALFSEKDYRRLAELQKEIADGENAINHELKKRVGTVEDLLKADDKRAKNTKEQLSDLEKFIQATNRAENKVNIIREAFASGAISISTFRREMERATEASEKFAKVPVKDIRVLNHPDAKKSLEQFDEAAERLAAATESSLQKQAEGIADLAYLYEDLFLGGVDNVWDSFKRQGIAIISDIAARWTLALLSGRSAGSFGSIAGGAAANSPLASLFGGFAANDNLPTSTGGINPNAPGGWTVNPNGGPMPIPSGGGTAAGSLLDNNAIVSIGLGALAGSLIGGGAGSTLGSLVGSFGGQALGSTLGFLGAAGGPIGAIAGGLLGSIVGGLFGSTKRGSAILNGGSITGFYGNSQSRKDAAAGLGGSVLDTINQIAEALGADVNAGAGKVSIGIRKGNIVVDPQGRGYTKTSKFSDLRSFGQDEEAAIKFAIQDLIRDGVLTGISAASQRLLGSGGDIEAQIEKAALIEAVPKLLAQRLDPLGYELEQIDEKFRKLADALREGGGTAEQFAQAEQLYMLERQDAIEQFGAVADQLKSFLESLGFGGNSPLSLRQQLANANAALDPFVAQIAAGQTVDQGAFTAAAQAVLDISRLINASSGNFFSDFDRVRDLTEQAIFNAEANTTVPGDAPDIFGQQTAENTSDIANILGDIRDILNGTANDNFVGEAVTGDVPFVGGSTSRSFIQ